MISVADIPPPVRVRGLPPNRLLWWGMFAAIGVGLALIVALVVAGQDSSANASQRGGLVGCGPGQPCIDVLKSNYGTVLGKSLTKWGLAYYLIVVAAMLVAVYAWQLSLSPPLSLILPVVTFVGLAAGGWCVAVMYWVLHANCRLCLSLHGVNLVLFGLATAYAVQDWRYRQHTRWQAGVPPLPSTPVAMHVVVALMLGTTLVVLMSLFRADAPQAVVPFDFTRHALGINAWKTGGMAPMEIGRKAPPPATGIGTPAVAAPPTIWTIKGQRDAPHRIVVFSCLTCPKCRELNAILKEIMARHPGQLRIDERFYPLWHGCNSSLVKGAMDAKHRDACALTRNALALAAAKPEAFADYVDWLYENQNTMSESRAEAEAQRRVGKEHWQRATDDPALWQRIREDLEFAKQLNIGSVPQMYLEQGQVYGGFHIGNLESLLAKSYGWNAIHKPDDAGTPIWVSQELIGVRAQQGLSQVQLGHYQEGVQELKEALRLKPDESEIAQELAWTLATCPDGTIRNGQEAVQYARQAQQGSKGPSPRLWDVLGAALAEAGEYQDAADAARKAMELYRAANSEKEAEEVRQRMEMYIGGRPYRTK